MNSIEHALAIAAFIVLAVVAIKPMSGDVRAVVAALRALGDRADAEKDIRKALFIGFGVVETLAILALVLALLLLIPAQLPH